MAPQVPLQDVLQLAARMPAYVPLHGGAMPDGEEGDEAVFFFEYTGPSKADQGETVFAFGLYVGDRWQDECGVTLPHKGWTAAAYLPLRLEHVEAVLGREVR